MSELMIGYGEERRVENEKKNYNNEVSLEYYNHFGNKIMNVLYNIN